jgi:DNA modification methylase
MEGIKTGVILANERSMMPTELIDQIIAGDCLRVLQTIPEKSVDMVFADTPYNLQLEKDLWRPNATKVNGVDQAWDQFSSFESYDRFTQAWLEGTRKVLKDTGTIWVIGSYHNIFRVGKILQDLGFWILNDVIWIKNNPMPNFHGVRFTNAHETLIWAQKVKGNKYTFNYQAMKSINQEGKNKTGVQMRSDWRLSLCTGKERLKINGEKAHPTQKPEALLTRIILASSNPGDVILDPFFGTGTTGAVAKKHRRHWIGIEIEPSYVRIAQQRINTIQVLEDEIFTKTGEKNKSKRIPFAALIQEGLLKEGQVLYFGLSGDQRAYIMANGHIHHGNISGSIHEIGRDILKAPCNGWTAWYYIDEETGNREPIDTLRKKLKHDTVRKADTIPVGSEEL